MAFFRLWLLILPVLALGVSPVFAGASEERAYAAATSAFHDQIWSQAETALATFLHDYPDSPHAGEAVLLEAQAQFHQAKFSDALSLLAAQKAIAGSLADQFDYWIGEIQTATGDYYGAANTFITLTQNYPASSIRLQATIEAASALVQDHRWLRVTTLLLTPNGIFQTAAGQNQSTTNDLVARGWLLLAEAQAAQTDFAGAAATLSTVKNFVLPPDLNWQRLYLLGQVRLGRGELDPAHTAATNALQIARSLGRTNMLAASQSVLAKTLEKLNRLPEATAVWTNNLADGFPLDAQQEAVSNLADLAIAQTNYLDAEGVLESFFARSPASPTSELTLLTLGELYLKDYVNGSADPNHLATARARFDQVLADTNSPFAGQAFLGRGWCDWLAGQIPASLTDFQNAVRYLAQNGSAEDQAVARFKTGDALFAQNDFVAARENYRVILNDFTSQPGIEKSLGDRALYQILRADLSLTNVPDAEQTLQRLLADFPHSDLATNSLLLAGEEFSDFSLPIPARATLQQCESLFPNSPLLPQVKFAIARTYEREQNWPTAIAGYESWLKQYATNDLAPQVEYARAQANFLSGNETNALALFTSFITRFQTNDLAPQAQWWIADYFFRAASLTGSENFAAAETNYENIFQNTNAAWRNSPLYYPSQLMAGRAAMGELGFSDACAYFVKLLSDSNCPPETAVPARFAYGAALIQSPSADTNNPLANFQMATNIFSQICHIYPTNDPGARAWGEIGNCAVQLGDLASATNAYWEAVSMPTAENATRNQAEVGLGLALEKFAAQTTGTNQTALLQQALQHYLAVFYDAQADAWWKKEAGLRVLPLLPVLNYPFDTSTNVITHLEHLFPQLTPALEKKKAALVPVKS